jgi:hypothetical protein
MFGFNTEKVVADELSALSANGEKFEFDWGDHIRAGLYGLTGKDYSKETLKKKVLALQTENINNDAQVRKDRKLADQYKPGSSVGLKREAGETLGDLRDRALIARSLGEGLSRAKRENPGIDLTGIETQSELDSKVSSFVKDTSDKATKKVDDRYDDEKEYRRLIAREGRLDRLHDKRMQNENSMMQMQLEYARMDQADRQRAADRKDKAVMALLGGLGNLGAAFTI